MIEQNDQKEIYCRRLGHCLQFGYCRRADRGLPCSSVIDCWHRRLPVIEFILHHYGEGVWERLKGPPRSKLERIAEIADRIRKEVG